MNKFEKMYYIALGTVVDYMSASDVYHEMARTADGEEERKRCLRKALGYKTSAIVLFDREMDRLVKEYK